MSRFFFKVFIRLSPVGSFEPFLTQNIGNYLDGYNELQLGTNKGSFKHTQDGTELNDGTKYIDLEEVSVECGTIKVSKAYYDDMLVRYKNELCDIVLADPNNDNYLIALQQLRGSIKNVVEKDETVELQLSFSAKWTVEDGESIVPLQIVDLEEADKKYIILTGVVTDDSETPIEGALITVTNASNELESYETLTDADGSYELMIPQIDQWNVNAEADGFVILEQYVVNAVGYVTLNLIGTAE